MTLPPLCIWCAFLSERESRNKNKNKSKNKNRETCFYWDMVSYATKIQLNSIMRKQRVYIIIALIVLVLICVSRSEGFKPNQDGDMQKRMEEDMKKREEEREKQMEEEREKQMEKEMEDLRKREWHPYPDGPY